MLEHQPVLLEEVIAHLAIQPTGIYVDATCGAGGHASAVLAHLQATGRMLLIDRDVVAIQKVTEKLGKDKRVWIEQGSYHMIKEWVEKQGIAGKVDGILADLGVSSMQLDVADRGFSFYRDGPLDMRMDQRDSMTASAWLNKASVQEIAQVIFQYGQERFAKRIARKIDEVRRRMPIVRTQSLADLVASVLPRREKHQHPATRTFQAIRIYLNQELTYLALFLREAFSILKQGGRLLVITFHSLEVQCVRAFLREYAQGEGIPKEIAFLPRVTQLKKIVPSQREITTNRRARSAMLFVLEKIK